MDSKETNTESKKTQNRELLWVLHVTFLLQNQATVEETRVNLQS